LPPTAAKPALHLSETIDNLGCLTGGAGRRHSAVAAVSWRERASGPSGAARKSRAMEQPDWIAETRTSDDTVVLVRAAVVDRVGELPS
jgi:hypothetical protein